MLEALRPQLIKEFKNQEWYTKWEKNYNKEKPIKEFFNKTAPYEWVNFAFTWRDTEEGHDYWEYIHYLWGKLVEKAKIKCDKDGINIGIEWEFWVNEFIPSRFFTKYNLVAEYYSGMYEKNDFFKHSLKTEKDIFDFFTEVLEKMKEMQKEYNEKYGKMNISTKGISIDRHSMVFNGLHIHLSLGEPNELKTMNFGEWVKRHRIAQWFKLKELPTFRAIHSHHIWGSFREYSYSYKRKRRFKPVIVTSIPTVELRIFDVEDVIYKTRRRKLAKFIYQLWKDYENDVKHPIYKTPFQKDGENLGELFKICEKIFSKKSTISTKIIEKGDNYMVLKQNHQKILLDNVWDKDECCIKLIK